MINSRHKYNLRANKAVGIMKEISQLKVSEQPKTDCRVTFTQFHPVTNTLCVHVQPHFLIINKSAIPILTKQSDGPSWMLEPLSVFHPPPMRDQKLHFGLQNRSGKEIWGPLIDLSDQEWTYLSVRPSFHEVLYLHGDMMYKLSQDQDVVSFVTLTYDDCDGIKTLIIKPALVVSNQTTNLLSFRGEVSQENSISNLEVNEDFIRVVKTTGGDVKQMSFLSLMSKGDGTDVYNLYLSTDNHHWSSNIRVYLDGESRFCTTVPTPEACDGNMPVIVHTNRSEGQVFIVVREDTKPQVKLHNGLLTNVMFREDSFTSFEQISQQESLYLTMPWIHQGFPFIEQRKLVFVWISPRRRIVLKKNRSPPV